MAEPAHRDQEAVVSLFDEYDLEVLRNSNEEPVLDDFERYLGERDDLCTCRECKLDIVALALNNLPARYRVSPGHGRTTSDVTPAQIRAAIIKACAIVERFPHHA